MKLKPIVVVFFMIELFNCGHSLSHTFDGNAYARFSTCRDNHVSADDALMLEYYSKIAPAMNMDRPKGYRGSVGIVGGSSNNMGAAYFAAIAALRVGADVVHIFCQSAAGPAIQSFLPDIIVHPLFDINVDKIIIELEKMDIVVFGSGLDTLNVAHSVNVWNRVIAACKNSKKPLIIDLEETFLTQAFVNSIMKYPSPGIILLANSAEFEVLYKFIKATGAFSDAQVYVNYDTLGDNILLVRKGCSDSGMSSNPLSSWSISNGGSPRRCVGQGHYMTGATATYFYWAIRQLPINTTTKYGPMFPAAVASFSAAKLVRSSNKMAYEEKGMSALTSDMIDKIHDVLNDVDWM